MATPPTAQAPHPAPKKCTSGYMLAVAGQVVRPPLPPPTLAVPSATYTPTRANPTQRMSNLFALSRTFCIAPWHFLKYQQHLCTYVELFLLRERPASTPDPPKGLPSTHCTAATITRLTRDMVTVSQQCKYPLRESWHSHFHGTWYRSTLCHLPASYLQILRALLLQAGDS